MASFLLKKRTQKTLEQKIKNKSPRVQDGYRTVIKSFQRFCMGCYDGRTDKEIFDELSILKGENQTTALYDVIQNWIDWNYQSGVLTSTLKQYFSILKQILHYKGFKLHPQDIKDNLEFKKRIKEELYALQLEDIQKIFTVVKSTLKGFYLALISTGARPGELLQVKKRDVDTTKKRIKITIHPENVKTRQGRSIWLTKEAASYLITRIRNLKDNDLVWTKNENPLMAEKSASKTFSRYCDQVGFTERYHSNNYRKITLYSFRSYFFGITADIHREGYAHRMIGHGGYLPQYDRMSDEKKLDWFLKLEPELLIDKSERLKIKNQRQQEEILNYEVEAKNEIESIKRELYEQKIATLKLIGEAIKNPEKFQQQIESHS